MVKRYEELTISDDFMFGKTMGDKVLCQDVLEQLLEEKVGELEDVQPQREFRYTSGGKPIRLDIYTRDKKRMYDAEMQNQNHQPVEKLELPKRSRFYQSTMDTDHLSKGKSYRELPEGRVLFLCTFDPFGRGYAKYSFQNLCKEDRELYLKDGTEKIFYNCAADPEKVPENLRELYDYIRSGKVGVHGICLSISCQTVSMLFFDAFTKQKRKNCKILIYLEKKSLYTEIYIVYLTFTAYNIVR